MNAFFRSLFGKIEATKHECPSPGDAPREVTDEDQLLRVSQQTLAALEEEFLIRRADVLSKLESAMIGDSGIDWEALAQDLHNIAGTAGHFGDEKFGELSRSLEYRIRISRTHLQCQEALEASWLDFAKAA